MTKFSGPPAKYYPPVPELKYMWGNTNCDWLPGQKDLASTWNAAISQQLWPDLGIWKLYQPPCQTGQSQALTARNLPKLNQKFCFGLF